MTRVADATTLRARTVSPNPATVMASDRAEMRNRRLSVTPVPGSLSIAPYATE
jgi:hypothetical protein